MVALMLVSVGLWLPGAGGALCTCFPRPDFHRLGPPPRPPGLSLPCNGTECCKALVPLSTDGAGYTGSYEATSETTLLVRPQGPVLSTTVSAGAADAATPRTASTARSPGTPPPLTGLAGTASQGGLPTGPSDTGAGLPNLNHPSSPPTASTSTNTQTSSVASFPTAPHDKAVAVTSSPTSHKSMPNSQTIVPPDSLRLATIAPHLNNEGRSGHGGGSKQKGTVENARGSISPLPFNGSANDHGSSSPLTSVVPLTANSGSNNKGKPSKPSQSQSTGANGDTQPQVPSNHQKPHSSPLPIGTSSHDGHATSTAPSANQMTDSNSSSENSTANPFGVGRSLGNYGLAAGELAAIGLGVVLVVLILLLLSIYWKKRYKANQAKHERGRVTPTPMKEETNYLHNYRVRGWAWRPAPNGPTPDDIERSDDKRALITSPVTSHLSLSSGSIDAGYGGGDTPLQGGPPIGAGHRHRNSGGTPGEGGGRDLCCSVSKYVLKTESSMSSGIGLSQGDLQESEVDDLVSYNPDRVLHMMNGRDGDEDHETKGKPNGRPISVPPRSSSLPGGGGGRQNVLRSQSNNAIRDKPPSAKNGYHHHFGGHRHRGSGGSVHKSTSSPNRLDRPASYDSILEDANETLEAHPRGVPPLHGTSAYRPLSQTDTAAFPILEAIRGPCNNGVSEVTSASNDYTDGVPEVASYTSLPATHHYQDASTAVRGLSHSATASPDHNNHRHKKRRKKRKHHAKSEADALDQVAMDTIINTLPPPKQGLTRLPPVGSSPRGERNGYSKNGESVA